MLILWAGGALMLLAALALLLPPFFGAGRRSAVEPRAPGTDLNVEIYRERLASLEAGHLSSEELARAKTELERELLADTDAEAGADRASRIGLAGRRRAGVSMGIAVALALPAGAVALYWVLGPGERLPAIASGEALEAPAPGAMPDNIEAMVAGLAARLEREPGDAEGWLMLARSYQVLERVPEALAAYARALELRPESPDVLVAYAELESIASGHRLDGAPRAKLERALEHSPDHGKALWLGALAALQAGEQALAGARFTRLLALLPPGSREAAELEKLMADAGLASPDASPASRAPTRLKVSVRLAPELAARVTGSEPLFVFARDAGGPPIPIAAARRTAGELPLTVELGDADAMVPGRTLAASSRWTVGARIAFGGGPRASAGDLEAATVDVAASPDTVSVELLIDSVNGE